MNDGLNDEQQAPTVEMTVNLSCETFDSLGNMVQTGEAQAQLDIEKLILRLNNTVTNYPYRDMEKINAEDYRIHIFEFSGVRLTLYYLGYAFEDFLACLIRLRNNVILKDLLMQEHLRLEKVEGLWNVVGSELVLQCEFRLYDTALVVLPHSGELLRIPYSGIEEACIEDYRLRITEDTGNVYMMSQLGRQLDWFYDHLRIVMQELLQKTETAIQSILPDVDPKTIHKVAPLFKEGRTVMRHILDATAPEIWPRLEHHLMLTGLGENYQFLMSKAHKERVCIGIKRGLMGDLTGEYIWFLIPMYGMDKSAPGNILAMEVMGNEQGKATYFFRIMSREAYLSAATIEELHRAAEQFLKDLNRAMIAINFRREPIYLSDERLISDEHEKYRFAVAKIPELRRLRQHYIGRVVHSEKWRQNVEQLISTADC